MPPQSSSLRRDNSTRSGVTSRSGLFHPCDIMTLAFTAGISYPHFIRCSGTHLHYKELAFLGALPMSLSRVVLSFVLASTVVLCGGLALRAAEDLPTPQQVFEKRIMPIFKSPDPSSCTQCHLAGVDLKNYILPSHEKTFLSLRDLGLINLEKPEDSRILRLINMGEASKGERLISDKVRKMEYDAFAEWIKASA